MSTPRDINLIAEAAHFANGDIHEVKIVIANYDNWLALYDRDNDPRYQDKARRCEQLLRTFVLHRRRGQSVSMAALRRQNLDEER
jgi:hypothetical protein